MMLFMSMSFPYMRNRDPRRENVENILAICLPIPTMQHISESLSASLAMRKSAWNDTYIHTICLTEQHIQPRLGWVALNISAYFRYELSFCVHQPWHDGTKTWLGTESFSFNQQFSV